MATWFSGLKNLLEEVDKTAEQTLAAEEEQKEDGICRWCNHVICEFLVFSMFLRVLYKLISCL